MRQKKQINKKVFLLMLKKYLIVIIPTSLFWALVLISEGENKTLSSYIEQISTFLIYIIKVLFLQMGE